MISSPKQIRKSIGNPIRASSLSNIQPTNKKHSQQSQQIQVIQQQHENKPVSNLINNERNSIELVVCYPKEKKNYNLSQKRVADLWLNELKGEKKSFKLNYKIKIQEKQKRKVEEITAALKINSKALSQIQSKHLDNAFTKTCKTERELIIKNKSIFQNNRHYQFAGKLSSEGQQCDLKIYPFDLNSPIFKACLQGETLSLMHRNDEKKDEQPLTNNNTNTNINNGINSNTKTYINLIVNNANNNNTNNITNVRSNLNNPYNNIHSNLYSQRHQLYYDFIETINFSNMMLYIVPIKFKPMQSYKYYVIKGNNHSVILKALRQRLNFIDFIINNFL